MDILKRKNIGTDFSVEKVYNGWVIRTEEIEYGSHGEGDLYEIRRVMLRIVCLRKQELMQCIETIIDKGNSPL